LQSSLFEYYVTYDLACHNFYYICEHVDRKRAGRYMSRHIRYHRKTLACFCSQWRI